MEIMKENKLAYMKMQINLNSFISKMAKKKD
jgi:hypothetical protein